ncbi:MAG: hypothetical protein FWH50_01320 [Coriobacteriia bacterium]|nr:hypothetical protein [Coriobacteriia bacterium]
MRKTIILALTILLAPSLLFACGSGGDSSPQGSGDLPAGDSSKTAYVIDDYYNPDGSFSSLGLALNEQNSEKVLILSEGDVFVIGSRRYEILSDSLTLIFYTQNSQDAVTTWWIDCAQRWIDAGFIQEVR